MEIKKNNILKTTTIAMEKILMTDEYEENKSNKKLAVRRAVSIRIISFFICMDFLLIIYL